MEGGAEIDPYVLERWGDNPNDPDKKSTKCTDKRASIDYDTALRRFEIYYDKLNKTDSGKMRGKMFDKKYNKKDKMVLYPGMPCSEKYLEEDGPSRYDMWGVDAFPEGNQIPVNVKDRVITHYYSPKEKYPRDLKYGPEITYTHLLNQYGEEGAKKFLDEKWDNKLFNRYFKEIKPPKWEKIPGQKPKRGVIQSIQDEESVQFDESIERRREKRSTKKQYSQMPVKFPIKKMAELKTKIIENPQIEERQEVDTDEREELNGLTGQAVFRQPIYNSKAPRSSSIEDYEDYDYLSVIYNVGDKPVLYHNRTKYIYEMPLLDNYLDENIFDNFKAELFELLEKPILALGVMTLQGPQLYD